LAGLAVGIGYFLGLARYMDGGSALCDAPPDGSCSTAWGVGADLLSVAAAVVLGGTFVTTATASRLVRHIASHARRDHG
jgi:hypothetical protein